MDDDILKHSLGMIRGLNIKTVCLIGGEPTIDPRFLRIVRKLIKQGYYVSVISNGIRFANEKFTEEMLEAGVSNIIISLKSTSREGYIRETQRDAHDSVLRGLANLGRLTKFTLSVTLCGSMIHDFDSVMAVIAKNRVSTVTFDTERPIIVGNKIQYNGPTPQETADLLVDMYSRMNLLKVAGVDYYVYLNHPFCLFPAWYINALRDEDRLRSGCQIFGGTGIIIDEHGTILPCNHFCNSGLGIVTEWQSGQDYIDWRMRESIASFYDRMSNYPSKKCESCLQWQVCGAGCRMNWFRFGENELIK